MILVLTVLLAAFVLLLLAREFADADPFHARLCPVRWHVWLGSSIALACGMLARIATVVAPHFGSDRTAALLTLTGLALRLAINRRRSRP